MRVAALDIGGTYIKYGVVADGVLSCVEETPTYGQQGAGQLLTRAAALVEAMGRIDAIGICTRGQVNCDTGTILYDPPDVIRDYTGTNLFDAFSRFSVPVAVENDVNCMALAEARCGAGQGANELICLTYGTAIGGAIVHSGSVCHGATWSAGEFGMTYVRGKFYEAQASTSALVRMARAVDASIADGRAITARMEEPAIFAIIDAWAALVAEGLASLIHALDPDLAVLGGGIMEDARILSLVSKHTRALIAPGFCCTLNRAHFGNRAGLIGAALLAEEMIGTV